MRTKLIKGDKQDNLGYGAGEGDIDIPGFREHDVYLSCKICSVKYEFDTKNGIRHCKRCVHGHIISRSRIYTHITFSI